MSQPKSGSVGFENGKMTGLEGNTDVTFIQSGGYLTKIRSAKWQKERYYKLLDDFSTVWYESRKMVGRKQTFSVNDIDSVRHGRQTEGLQRFVGEKLEGRCFSIIFKGRKENLDLIAGSEEDASHWITGLEKVVNMMQHFSRQQSSEHWIFTCMRKADKDNDNRMNLKEIKHFLKQINIQVNDHYAEQIFKQCDTNGSGTLEGAEIMKFYSILTKREEIDTIYNEFARTNNLMGATDLLDFLLNQQREQLSLEDAHQLIQKYELDETAKQNQCMTKDGFLMYLQQEGVIFNPAHKDIYQDMNQPLNHYFISSSHNTYLMEDQLKGPSSTEAYIRALMKGCRCVELDCWDGVEGEPVIYHGHTLTSKVLFKDVIKAIKEYAFKVSEFPVILSMENHCSIEQQKRMAYHMINILGSALVTEPLGDTMPTSLPSPKELKGRILVKGKCMNKLDVFFNPISAMEEGSVSEEDEAAEMKEESKPINSNMKLAKELSDVVIYCKSVHFKGFEYARDNQSFYELASLKESKALQLAKTSANAFTRHNAAKLSRIYPAGSRTDSSNYNPVPMWNVGCQIVALNFQTPCCEMDLNQGLFLPNGRCGYILKPKFLRDKNSGFDPNGLSPELRMQNTIFHVMVISAQQLPKLNTEKPGSIVDPLVKVEIFGVPGDTVEKKTHHINNNGFKPMWNEKFKFIIHVPELTLVRFEVEDYDTASNNDFIGQYTLPFTSIQNGYRHIPLYNKRGHLIPSAGLFVHVMIMNSE
ncbi:1-phosphatidylinositol 4,5-bisphosphate phosphodiesterase delta-1a [Paramormyrops kingsleyae]|uniref:Phosphoinositide phospholipase C n=1 Tax=Paramormyrops kingsleyae TaxID=1676925 RepID=A0A3B3SKW1_9TELE|nr:1-phosphatidylinositol 4,5-bisphosphate phosphodiesterase delta-1 isoform X1 [Paramormyrops kingsleyae]